MMYLALKSLHLASAMCFVSGLTMLAIVTAGWPPTSSVLLPHERRVGHMALRWDRRVTLPAMAATWALGLGLASWGGWMDEGWFQGKLLLVVALSAAHGALSAALRKRLNGASSASASWTRASPALVSFGVAVVALLVVMKP